MKIPYRYIMTVILSVSLLTVYSIAQQTESPIDDTGIQPTFILEHDEPIRDATFIDNHTLHVNAYNTHNKNGVSKHNQYTWQLHQTADMISSDAHEYPISRDITATTDDHLYTALAEEHQVIILDTTTREPLSTLNFYADNICQTLNLESSCQSEDGFLPYAKIQSLVFLPDNRLLVSGLFAQSLSGPHMRSILLVWDWQHDTVTDWTSIKMANIRLTLNPRASQIVVQGAVGGDSCGRGMKSQMQLWDIDPLTEVAELGETYHIESFDFSPSADFMVMGATQHPCLRQPNFGIYLWRDTSQAVEQLSTDVALDVAWHPTQDAFFATTTSAEWSLMPDTLNAITLWKIDHATEAQPFVTLMTQRGKRITQIEFSPDGKFLIATGDSTSNVYIWDMETILNLPS